MTKLVEIVDLVTNFYTYEVVGQGGSEASSLTNPYLLDRPNAKACGNR